MSGTRGQPWWEERVSADSGQRTPALLTAPAKGSWPALPQGLCLSPQPCPGPPTPLQGWLYLLSQDLLLLDSSGGPLRVPPPPSPGKLALPLLSGPTSPLHHLFVKALISVSLRDMSPGGPRGGPAPSLTWQPWLGAPAGPLRAEASPGPEGGRAAWAGVLLCFWKVISVMPGKSSLFGGTVLATPPVSQGAAGHARKTSPEMLVVLGDVTGRVKATTWQPINRAVH